MALSRATGHPSYISSGTVGFIPAIWSGKLSPKWYATTVFGAIANTDWSGDVKDKGDTVEIRLRPSISIRNYEVGGGLTYEKPTSTKIQLLLDKAKYFGVEVEDVDAYQSDLMLMEEFTDDASEQMKIAIDTDLLGGVYAGAATTNAGATAGKVSAAYNLGTIGSPLSVTKANVIDVITRFHSVLSEANVPLSDRWIVLPAWMTNRILNSDLKDSSLTGDGTSIIRNGRIGRIANMTVYESNNLAATSSYTHIIAGHKQALAFASQITKVENLRNPNDFGDLVRGLNVYGYKVVNEDGIAHGVVAAGT